MIVKYYGAWKGGQPLTLTEAANELGKTRQGVHYMIQRGQLPAKKVPLALNIGGNDFYYDIAPADVAAAKGGNHEKPARK